MYLQPVAARRAEAPVGLDAAVRAFHVRLPGYAATPLIEVPVLADELGVRLVLVKDESARIGLPAFKILGASWAIAQLVARRFGLDGTLDLDRLRLAVGASDLRFITATDGNHGRAVARMAGLVGARATIVVPEFVEEMTVGLIAAEGADVMRIAGDYDAAVRRAAQDAETTGAILVQDTGWHGYEQVPQWIVDGYSTLLAEIDDVVAPDLIVVPVGVGSLAQAVVTHYRGRPTRVVSVEPDVADCVRRSLLAGQPVVVSTAVTVMAGLNAGTVSALAWPHLRDGLSAAVAVSDDQAAAAAADLARHGVRAGPCGAATLAGIRHTPLQALGLDHNSTVVLLSTDGALTADLTS